jgi:hypothetical protein
MGIEFDYNVDMMVIWASSPILTNIDVFTISRISVVLEGITIVGFILCKKKP